MKTASTVEIGRSTNYSGVTVWMVARHIVGVQSGWSVKITPPPTKGRPKLEGPPEDDCLSKRREARRASESCRQTWNYQVVSSVKSRPCQKPTW